MRVFEELESEVQSYARNFPRVFNKAQNEYLFDEEGNKYLDFLSGAGSLNYGHNHPALKSALLEYIAGDGIIHSLDLHTKAKREFMQAYYNKILEPRGMDHIIMFPGPTGTNSVEAALKIARNYTGRQNIITFTNGFHGCTLGSLGATGNSHHRKAAGISLPGYTRMPYDGYLGDEVNTVAYIDKTLSDSSSGIDAPAAVLVETVQGEGGINACSNSWLRDLSDLCQRHGMLLIIDDIQAGCGRAGSFFSFEDAGIVPDIVTQSKSLSGYGLPFSLVLMRPQYDQWKPGEHNGTFRGHNPAFVTAKAAIDIFWSDTSFQKEIASKGRYIQRRLEKMAELYGDDSFTVRGKGMFLGLNCVNGELAGKITKEAFKKGVVIETSGADDQVIKIFCPLTISHDSLKSGLDKLEAAIHSVCAPLTSFPHEQDYFDNVVLEAATVLEAS